jgi:hypothetical protein
VVGVQLASALSAQVADMCLVCASYLDGQIVKNLSRVQDDGPPKHSETQNTLSYICDAGWGEIMCQGIVETVPHAVVFSYVEWLSRLQTGGWISRSRPPSVTAAENFVELAWTVCQLEHFCTVL